MCVLSIVCPVFGKQVGNDSPPIPNGVELGLSENHWLSSARMEATNGTCREQERPASTTSIRNESYGGLKVRRDCLLKMKWKAVVCSSKKVAKKLPSKASGEEAAEVPSIKHWFRAPYFGVGDRFWQQLEDKRTVNRSQVLLGVPEAEEGAEGMIAPESIMWLHIERGLYPYAFPAHDSYAFTKNGGGFDTWAEEVLTNPSSKEVLKNAGVYGAIVASVGLNVRREPSWLSVAFSRWSSNSHTFVTRWGELTPTLEDVCALTGLPILGVADPLANKSVPSHLKIVSILKASISEAGFLLSGYDKGGVYLGPQRREHCKNTFGGWLRYWYRDLNPSPAEGTEIEENWVNGPGYEKIKKCFRGRKAVEAERLRVREHFFMTYGKHCQNVDRNQLKDQLFMTSDKFSTSIIFLLEAVILLIDPGLPWSWESIKFQDSVGKISSLESILALIIPHVGQRSCVCANIDPRWSFSSQILTIPFLWKLFPYLKEIFATRGLSVHYIHQMALCVQNHANDVISQPDCSFDMAIDFVAVVTFLLEALPPMQSSNKESKEGMPLT
ncbi:unnamed protein product [Camellia sinensis]